MGIRRLNHAVLYVRDVARSVDFYTEILGFRVTHQLTGVAFLRAAGSDNDHDLGLFQVDADARASDTGSSTVGLYHLAWSVATLNDLAQAEQRLRAAGVLVGSSDHVTSKSLYARDPDGIEFELGWFVPRERVTAEMESELAIRPLDIDEEIATWGADLIGAP